MRKTYTGLVERLEANQIFVFGSNTEGRHGAGAAAVAAKLFGAKYGQAKGPQGRSYAICTKDLISDKQPSVSKKFIIDQIKDLYYYAEKHPKLEFLVAYSGKGLNFCYYTPEEMAAMFARNNIPNNIIFEKDFAELVGKIQKSNLTTQN